MSLLCFLLSIKRLVCRRLQIQTFSTIDIYKIQQPIYHYTLDRINFLNSKL